MFFCRLQYVKGTLHSTLHKSSGKLDYGKPLKEDEVRVFQCQEWIDLYCDDLAPIQQYISDYRQGKDMEGWRYVYVKPVLKRPRRSWRDLEASGKATVSTFYHTQNHTKC